MKNNLLLKIITSAIGACLIFSFCTLVSADNQSLWNAATKVETNLPKLHNTNLCIEDFFETEDSHGTIVKKFADKYTDVKLTEIMGSFNLTNTSYNHTEYQECDVLSISIGIYFFANAQKSKDLEFATLDRHFQKYYVGTDTLLITASGNDLNEDSKVSAPLSRYKAIVKSSQNSTKEQKDLLDRIFIIGQAEQLMDGTYLHQSTEGLEVDFVVANYNEPIDNKAYTGSSFATPVVSGVLATLIDAGIPQADLRKVIGYSDSYEHNGITYNVFSIAKTYLNAYKYLDSMN